MEKLIADVKQRIMKLAEFLKPQELKSTRGELETKSMEPDFWNKQNAAKEVMQEISEIDAMLKALDDLNSDISNLVDYWKLVKENPTPEDEKQVQEELTKVDEKLSDFELKQFLSGRYDKNDAILSIHAGQGGTEANDWAEMLLRMYLRYAERQGWKTEVVHKVRGEEAGISTVTMEITGTYVFGYLKNEKGTHRLVRISPFNAQNLRQTSFAGVEVIPILKQTQEDEIQIPKEDIDFKATHSSGPGGQNVNKVSTAVIIKHIPTGIIVHSSAQRSQFQNRETAMRELKAKLAQIRLDEQKKEISDIKGEHKMASWGNQIRNYVLHPYKLVKDLRTGIESGNPDAVLDGEMDKFIEAEIRLVS